MTNIKFGNDDIRLDGGESTDVTFGTTARYASERYVEKKEQIDDLKYECRLLMDKYYSEMERASIPYEFRESNLLGLFSTEKDETIVKESRNRFLRRGFSADFLVGREVEFVRFENHGWNRTAIGVVLGIGGYEYTIEFPQPSNITTDEDRERLMGWVRFRVGRVHKSHKDDFTRYMETVQAPTYDWKQCFEAIEKAVEEEGKKEEGEKA